MLSAATHPHPAEPADLAEQRAEDDQHYRAMLRELIDMGMDLARSVHKQGTAQAGDADALPAHQTAAAFDRISRAVRRTVAMARHVAQPVPVRAAASPGALGPEQKRAAARRQIIREVEDVIQRTAEVDRHALHAELFERLDASELDEEIDNRPTAEVIADICRDLGLGRFLGNHPWKRRTPGDVAALCAWAARPLGAGPAPHMARPVPGHGEPWPEPTALPSDAGADAAPASSDEACVAQMWRVLAEAGVPTPFRPRDG